MRDRCDLSELSECIVTIIAIITICKKSISYVFSPFIVYIIECDALLSLDYLPFLDSSPSCSPTKPQAPEGKSPGPFLCTLTAVSSLISTQEVLSKFQWNAVENQSWCGLSSHLHPVCVFKPSFVGMPSVTHNIHPGQPSPFKSPLALVSTPWMHPDALL